MASVRPLAHIGFRVLDDIRRADASHPEIPTYNRIMAGVDWLSQAQDHGADDGFSYGYTIRGGWQDSYVETTGYIIGTFLDVAKRFDRPDLARRAEDAGEWLLGVQLGDGSFPNPSLEPESGLVFDTGQDLHGLLDLAEQRAGDRYDRAARRAATWLVEIADDNGLWTRNTFNGIPHVYNARSAWALVHPGSWTFMALVISALTLVLMLRGRRLHRLFPGVLVAVVVALVYSRSFDYDGAVIPDVEAGLPTWSLDLPWASTGSLITGGLVIALVGFAEPASIARTFANEDQTRWSSSREFFASGLANTVAGLTGAYPVGGSFSRSSVNRFAGAETRASGAITGLVVLAFLPFAGLLDGLPDAVLGAIVVGAVLSLVKPKRLARLWKRSPWQAGLAWITFVATLLTPPNVQYAVLLGVAFTAALHFFRPFHLDVESTADGELHLRPRGLLWIATNSKLKAALREEIANDSGSGMVTVSLDRSTAIDAAIADAVAAGQAQASRDGREYRVTNAPDGGVPILENFDLTVV